MVEAYKQFTFEAAHALPPHSGLHGHTFRIDVVFSGEPDPEFGWCENLDEIEGLEKPSLENLARWIWDRLAVSFPDTLDRVQVARGPDGMSEGCTYSARPRLHAA